ncbi:hypothetical protein M8818_002350 [Zalaria obscura]|uniref:Uncharacterized protein n=1 Tax=Zalaria obscura TaxID=2024903 RepID=A0ACC3SI59_9PEZI
MSFPSTRIGGSAFNHQQSSNAEAEYDRLRDLARQEHGKYQSCAAKSQQAYQRGDGAGAHELSEEGKRHAAKADDYNKQASDYIFRENNAVGRVDSDTIDLHGQFVEEAEEILEQRIRYAQSTGQTHLHVIVGKGNHSTNHLQKIKPRVEQVCQELGFKYTTEHNEGRMYIDLTGGNAQSGQYNAPTQYNQQQYGQPHYQTAYPMGGQPQYNAWQQGGYPAQQQHQQQQNQYGGQSQQQMEMEQEIKKALPKVFRLIRSCCTVM